MKADFFTSLASQVLGAAPGIHPLLPPRFATWPGALGTGEEVTSLESSTTAEERTGSFAAPLIEPGHPSIHLPVPSFRQMAHPTPSPQPDPRMEEILIPEGPGFPTEEFSPEAMPTAPLIQAQHVPPTGQKVPALPEAPTPDANHAPTAPQPVPPLLAPPTIAQEPVDQPEPAAARPLPSGNPDRKTIGAPVEAVGTWPDESESPTSLKPELPARTSIPLAPAAIPHRDQPSPEPVPTRTDPLKAVIDPAKLVLPPAAAFVPPVEAAAAGVESRAVRAEHPAAPSLPPIPNRVEAFQAQPEDVVTRPGPVPYQPEDCASSYERTENPIASALPQSLPFSPVPQPEASTAFHTELRGAGPARVAPAAGRAAKRGHGPAPGAACRETIITAAFPGKPARLDDPNLLTLSSGAFHPCQAYAQS